MKLRLLLSSRGILEGNYCSFGPNIHLNQNSWFVVKEDFYFQEGAEEGNRTVIVVQLVTSTFDP